MDVLTCAWCLYLEMGAGYKMSFDTDEPIYRDGSNPTARFSLGVTNRRIVMGRAVDIDISYEHTSHWREGPPFNNDMEWSLGQFLIKSRVYLNN